jgi:hypothetical protein
MSKDITKMTDREKLDYAGDLHYTKGYATALKDFLTMVLHLKGEDADGETTITLKEIEALSTIAIESQPLYQEYKKDNGIK